MKNGMKIMELSLYTIVNLLELFINDFILILHFLMELKEYDGLVIATDVVPFTHKLTGVTANN